MTPSCWAVLPLLLLAGALHSCLAADYGWQPQKEFSFSVQGQDLAGLPQLKSQYAGYNYQGELQVQTHSSRVLLLKFYNMNFTKVHEELPKGWWKGPEAPYRNKTKTLPMTTSTVVVKLTRSMSPELVVHSGLDDWQVNFIKGVVSHLLVYMSDSSAPGHYSNRLTHSHNNDVYSVIEDSVVGRCEVMYEVTPLPQQLAPHNMKFCDGDRRRLWEVTKTRNYSSCQVLSEDHAHLPTARCTPGGANCGQFWTRASVTQMIGCGDMTNMVLLSSISSSSVNSQLHLQDNSRAVVNSKLNITLNSVLDLKTKFNTPSSKQTLKSLLYSYSSSPKVFSSRSCQDSKNSEEEDISNDEPHDSSDQMNPTKQSNSKEFDSIEKGHSQVRSKRGIKNKYKTKSNKAYNESNENRNNYASNEQNASEENRNNFKSKRTDDRRHRSWRKSSEESNNQPSEELGLEDQWSISGKEMRGVPPHQPFNIFTVAHRTSYDLSCLNPKLRQIIGDIANDLEEINILPEKNTMDKLSLAVDICRSLPLDQLSSVGEEVFEVHNGASSMMKNKERKVFRDVVNMCGTHPALTLIRGWVERQQVEGEEASQMIASLPSHIFSPTKYMVQDFFEMVQQIAEQDNKQLTTTAVLAMSSLVRRACVNKASRQHYFSSIIKPTCGESLVNHYTDWLAHKIDSEPQLRRAYIEALGNLGSPQVMHTLRDISVDSKYSSYHRTLAVFAMRYQVLAKNPEVVPLLMSLYHNYKLPTSTRIAAVALIIYSNPGLVVWQRLALSTWYEPSTAVVQFVASTLRTVATSKDSLYSHATKSAALVQPLARPSKVNIHQPYNLLTSWVSDDLEKIVLEQLSWMHFYDFSSIYYRHSSRTSGFSRTNIETSFSTANPDGLWVALKELMMSSNTDKSRPPTPDISRTLTQIRESLGLRSRNMPQVQAELHLKINNMMERMLVVDKDMIKSWTKGGQRFVSELMSNGKSLSYQKADMDSMHISTTTELGFPVEFSVRTPWIVQAKAELNGTREALVAGATFMYSSQLLASLSVMSPWDNMAHTAGAYATNFLQLPPFRVETSLDSANETVKLSTTYIDQHRLLYFNMRPFTSQRRVKIHQAALLSPDTIPIKLGEQVQMPISWMSRYLNTVYSTEETGHFHPLDFLRQARGVLGFPMVMPNMETRSFETVMKPLHPIVMNLSMSMASKTSGLIEIESPKENTLVQIFNTLTRTKKSQDEPSSSTPQKPNNKKTEKSGNTEKSQTSDESGSEVLERMESTTVRNTNNSSSEEKKTDASFYVGGHQVYSTTYDSAVGAFNATIVDPFANSVNGSNHYYLIEQALAQINSGRAVVFAFNMWSTKPDQPTKLSAYAAYANTYSQRVSRFGLFLKNDVSQTRMTSAYEAPVDITTDLERRVTDDLQHNIFVDYNHLESGQNIKAIIKTRLGVSRSTLARLRTSPLLHMCSQNDSVNDHSCQQLHAQTRQIGFGNITVYYSNDAKFMENTVRKYMEVAKVILPRTEEKSGEGYNTMSLVFDVNHRTESVNAYVKTTASSIHVRRLPLSRLPMPTLVEWATHHTLPRDYCGVSTQKVRTFDRAEFQHRMKDNWHLVAQDCSGQYGISVLVQPSSNNTLNVEVNMDDHSVITLEADGLHVYVNNKLQPLDAAHPLMVVSDRQGRIISHTVHTPDHSIHIQLPVEGLDLVYSASALVMRANEKLQGRLCGLCGSYTGTGVEQFLTAKGTVARSAKEFSDSYIFNGSEMEQAETRS